MKVAVAVLVALVQLFLGGCETSARGPVTISSGWELQDVAKTTGARGEAISKTGYRTEGWYKATVPGTVLTSLVNDGVYPEPLYGESNRPDRIPESLCRTSYWYRTEVGVPAEFGGGRHIWLNFEGINYTADVWVNGVAVGTIKGAFSRGIFDVSKHVRAGGKAAIAVCIHPPPHPGNPQEQTQILGTGRNGGELMRDGATFGCTVGWDWMPAIRDRDMGIWQKVTLSETGPVRVEDPSVSSELPLPRTDSADLTLLATLKNATDKKQSGKLRAAWEGGNIEVPVTLEAKEVREVKVTPAESAPLHVMNPRLWWPNTYGEPNLYEMRVWFEADGMVSDARDMHFGIRKITYQVPAEQTLIAPSENLTVFVNGVPIVCKGGCWGMDEAMKRIPRARLEAQVRYHQLANYTMIRNWVGQSTSEDFYDLCDRYGILVWDEMFQANQSDGPAVDDVEMYLANVREKVVRFRSHPSIALWCGRNESYPAPAAVAEGITKLTAELDPARFYQANSGDGRGVRSGGPYAWRVPAAYYSGTGFGRGRGGLGGVLEPFKTELGSVSIPTLEAIKAMMPEKDWYEINDDWASHDLCSGAQQGNQYPRQLAARYGAIGERDLADFVRKSQLAMYETYRAMYEGRFSRLFNPCTGVLTWMSNPAQPSFVWQIYSYDLEPLAALYGAKKACEPLHIQMNQSDVHLVVVNTMPEEKGDLAAIVGVYNMDGTRAGEQRMAVRAKACAATDLGEIAFPNGLSPVHFVKLELLENVGTAGGTNLRGEPSGSPRVVSENFYWRTTVGSTQPGPGRNGTFAAAQASEDFSSLQSMPAAAVDVSLVRRDEGEKCMISVGLRNASPVPALLVHLQLRKADNSRVLPVYYSDNFVSLLPGERRMLTIEAPAEQIGAGVPVVMVDGWNVTTATRSFEGVGAALNADARPGGNGKSESVRVGAPGPAW